MHIVALSGGKDSCAMALRLKELYPWIHYVYVCTPTGDELPDMIEHWKSLEHILGQPIIKLHHPDYNSIYELIDDFQMLPNHRARWCTRILKIEAIQYFYNLVKPAIVYVGLRADENRQGAKLLDPRITQCYPMQDWGWDIQNVWAYLSEKRIAIPRRTDCAMCFYQRIDEWYSLWEQYPNIFKKIEDIELAIGHTLMTPGKHKIWPHQLQALRREFEKGRMPRAVSAIKKQQRKSLTSIEAFNFDYGASKKCRMCSL